MDRPTDVEMTPPCGVDCFDCAIYEHNVTPEAQKRVADRLGVDPARVRCRGCRIRGEYVMPDGVCATMECARDRKVRFCFECSDFPCPKLAPTADGADLYPHNLKMYNLCRIRAVGVEKWAEEASRTRHLYFDGRFSPGRGPVEREE